LIEWVKQMVRQDSWFNRAPFMSKGEESWTLSPTPPEHELSADRKEAHIYIICSTNYGTYV